ncbi:hypothetical protein Lal_00030087 [Lupinus albus]|nr:hypothetical protein Lal_00030087 [Lupinus albus]
MAMFTYSPQNLDTLLASSKNGDPLLRLEAEPLLGGIHTTHQNCKPLGQPSFKGESWAMCVMSTFLGFLFPHHLEVKGTNTFVELNGKLYPSLIREFYSNFQYRDGLLGGLSSFGSQLSDCEWESIAVVEMYKSCLLGPHYFLSGELTKVGPMTFQSRLMHYVIAYILFQQNTNPTQPTINDLKLVFAIWEGILFNWPSEILKVMFGIASSSSRLFAYEIFISRIIDHMEIDTFDVEFQLTNTCDHLVGEHLIHKMGINWITGQ